MKRVGKLRLHGQLSVGADGGSWEELQCYLFDETLICAKDKRTLRNQSSDDQALTQDSPLYALKGSIFIKKHLESIESVGGNTLMLNLAVTELPYFFLRFPDNLQLELWRNMMSEIQTGKPMEQSTEYFTVTSRGTSTTEDEDSRASRGQSFISSEGPVRSNGTINTDYTDVMNPTSPSSLRSLHVPVDIVVVASVCSSSQGLKISLLRDALNFLVRNLGPRDRMGLVTFDSNGGAVPVAGMSVRSWHDWNKALWSVKPVWQKAGQPSPDIVDGVNVAMNLLMQRKSASPVSNIILISDTATSDKSAEQVMSRIEGAKFVALFLYFFKLEIKKKKKKNADYRFIECQSSLLVSA